MAVALPRLQTLSSSKDDDVHEHTSSRQVQRKHETFLVERKLANRLHQEIVAHDCREHQRGEARTRSWRTGEHTNERFRTVSWKSDAV
jgi:hypothetical protein